MEEFQEQKYDGFYLTVRFEALEEIDLVFIPSGNQKPIIIFSIKNARTNKANKMITIAPNILI